MRVAYGSTVDTRHYRHSDDMMSSYLCRDSPGRRDARDANPPRFAARTASAFRSMREILTRNLEAEPIFTLPQQRYDIPLVDAEYELEIISADHEVAAAPGAARE
jgi:hypothetical protein